MPETGNPNCVICQEAITNPMCPTCLEAGMVEWFTTRNPAVVAELRAWSPVFTTHTAKGIRCVVCKGPMNICSHCYTGEIMEALNEQIDDLEAFTQAFQFYFGNQAG